MRRLIVGMAAALLLAACAPVVRMKGSADDLAAQRAREQALGGLDHWLMQGRLGVYDAHGGGSGDFVWTQTGVSYDFTLRGPSLSGVDLHLHGDAQGATLVGVKDGPLRGASAEALMRQALGWEVPLDELRAWVLGLRAPGHSAELDFGAGHLPSLLRQDGWAVDYRVWDVSRQPPLPSKVYAEKPPYKVKLAIDSFQWGARPLSAVP